MRIALALLVLVAGCRPADHLPSPEDATPAFAGFTCTDEHAFELIVRGDSATLLYGMESIPLAKESADAGVRFSGAGYDVFQYPDHARLLTPEATFERCGALSGTPWAERAWREGFSFVGMGNEPGWHITVGAESGITLVGNYGQDTTRAAYEMPEVVDGKSVYTVSADPFTLVISLADSSCQDDMSGRMFPATVSVQVDEYTFAGCGRRYTF